MRGSRRRGQGRIKLNNETNLGRAISPKWPCLGQCEALSAKAPYLFSVLDAALNRGRYVRTMAITWMIWLGFAASCLVASQAATNENLTEVAPSVLLVVGAAGAPEYGTNFLQQVELWQETCARAKARITTLGIEEAGQTNECDRFRLTLAAEPKDCSSPLWVVMVGHGTFDGKEAWFNLRGPDVSAADLSLWLRPFSRPLVVINTASSSAPFLNALSASNRVVITATRSGHEQNFTRFGKFFAEAIGESEADLDKDGQISLLEAFLAASRQTAEFYKVQGRLATEHALLDDNGDGLGTPAEWFRGLRATKKPQDNAAVDGLAARMTWLAPGSGSDEPKLLPQQRARADELERAVLLLRVKKEQMPENEYYDQLEKLLLELAGLYRRES